MHFLTAEDWIIQHKNIDMLSPKASTERLLSVFIYDNRDVIGQPVTGALNRDVACA